MYVTVLVQLAIHIVTSIVQYSRNVSQTRWIIDDERMGEASVEVLSTPSADDFYHIIYVGVLMEYGWKTDRTVIHL